MSMSHGTATHSPLSLVPLDGGDASDFGLARVRDLAFDSVIGLWRKRRAEGMTQRDLLKRMRSSPATLRGICGLRETGPCGLLASWFRRWAAA